MRHQESGVGTRKEARSSCFSTRKFYGEKNRALFQELHSGGSNSRVLTAKLFGISPPHLTKTMWSSAAGYILCQLFSGLWQVLKAKLYSKRKHRQEKLRQRAVWARATERKKQSGFARSSNLPLAPSRLFVLSGKLALLNAFDRGRGFRRRHAVIFVGPVAEVDELATLRAERAVWIIFPSDGLFADRTLHKKTIDH